MLPDVSSQCAGAGRLLIADSDLTYSNTAFDALEKIEEQADIMGLSHITEDTLAALSPEPKSHSGYCKQLVEDWTGLCVSGADAAGGSVRGAPMPLSAVLLSQSKLRGDGRYSGLLLGQLAFKAVATGAGPGSDTVAAVETFVLGRLEADGWTWRSGCYRYPQIEQQYGMDPRIWDMEQWKKDRFCLRVSKPIGLKWLAIIKNIDIKRKIIPRTLELLKDFALQKFDNDTLYVCYLSKIQKTIVGV